MNTAFTNLFGGHADDYRRYRPSSPDALCEFVKRAAPDNDRLLDCGTGNGQAATALSELFKHVDGVDASPEQIANAVPKSNVRYRVADASVALPFDDESMSAVTAATALHWFATPKFFEEVRRVLKPRGLFIAWTYAGARSDPAVEAVVNQFSQEFLKPFWDERVIQQMSVYDGDLPFEKIEVPEFSIVKEWSMHDYVGYLRTWSAYRAYLRETGEDPLRTVWGPLAEAWGTHPTRTIRWNLHVLAGRRES